jgi:hypothetical protein
LSRNLINIAKEDKDFGCDAMEHESRARTKSPHFGDNSHDEVVINFFTLKLVYKEVIDARLHHVENEE